MYYITPFPPCLIRFPGVFIKKGELGTLPTKHKRFAFKQLGQGPLLAYLPKSLKLKSSSF